MEPRIVGWPQSLPRGVLTAARERVGSAPTPQRRRGNVAEKRPRSRASPWRELPLNTEKQVTDLRPGCDSQSREKTPGTSTSESCAEHDLRLTGPPPAHTDSCCLPLQICPSLAMVHTVEMQPKGQRSASALHTRLQRSTSCKSRMLLLRKAPHHQCVAFVDRDIDAERDEMARHAPVLLQPRTRRLLAELQGMGGMPPRSCRRPASSLGP